MAPIDKDVWKCYITESGELCAMISLTTKQQELSAICLASGMNNRLLCSVTLVGLLTFIFHSPYTLDIAVSSEWSALPLTLTLMNTEGSAAGV